jgi:hypothetical protein
MANIVQVIMEVIGCFQFLAKLPKAFYTCGLISNIYSLLSKEAASSCKEFHVSRLGRGAIKVKFLVSRFSP